MAQTEKLSKQSQMNPADPAFLTNPYQDIAKRRNIPDPLFTLTIVYMYTTTFPFIKTREPFPHAQQRESMFRVHVSQIKVEYA